MKFKTVDRKTLFLMPLSVDDWLSKKHIARFVVEILDELDLSEIEAHYSSKRKTGLACKSTIWRYLLWMHNWVFSSRSLEQTTCNSAAP